MLSAFSHEIRNPLTLINSSLQLIEAAHPETQAFRFWPQVREDVRYLSLLLDDFSQFSNAASLHRMPVDLNALAASAAASFASQFESRKMNLTFTPCENLPPVSADPVKLKQVLVNLLKNAMEAMNPGGAAALFLDFDTSFAYLSVADTGCGIPAEHREEIFLPFKTFKPQGTGLGLPISKQIAAAHGGDLTFRTPDRQGTVFTLSIPLHSTDTP